MPPAGEPRRTNHPRPQRRHRHHCCCRCCFGRGEELWEVSSPACLVRSSAPDTSPVYFGPCRPAAMAYPAASASPAAAGKGGSQPGSVNGGAPRGPVAGTPRTDRGRSPQDPRGRSPSRGRRDAGHDGPCGRSRQRRENSYDPRGVSMSTNRSRSKSAFRDGRDALDAPLQPFPRPGEALPAHRLGRQHLAFEARMVESPARAGPGKRGPP